MMKIKIIAVGKIKEKYISDGINEFLKRLSNAASVQIIEVKEYDLSTKLSNEDILKIMKNEALEIKKHLKDDYVIPLCIEGKQIDSVELSKKISEVLTYSSKPIAFIIGGSNGLDESIKEIADFKLSFSKMTFPHQLMRLILLEQLYRTVTIMNNSKYHK